MSGKDDFSPKRISPKIGGGRVSGGSNRLTSSFDLIEQTHFLYIEILRARKCPVDPRTGVVCDPFIDITLGNLQATTKNFASRPNLELNHVFAFDRSKGDALDVVIRDRQFVETPVIGQRQFTLAADVPTRVPPDARIAPQWYTFGSNSGNAPVELLMSVWFGTQADEVYSVAWHSEASTVNGECMINTRPKVYLAPRLCYVRVTVVSAHDLISRDRNREPEAYVKAALGNVTVKTKVASGNNPSWNEDLMFVAAEPLDDTMVISVMDRLDKYHEECLGTVKTKLSEMTPIKIPGSAPALFYNLEPAVKIEPAGRNYFASKMRMRLSTDQTYHVFDEASQYCSDYRAYVKSLWPGQLGALEIGILGATGLHPMKHWTDGRKSTDAYCVAKYGNKWVRTRTVVDSLDPKWNEQYTWEVYDPYTVVTIGVYDNCQLYGKDSLGKDVRIGKVRIRLSMLKACNVYAYSCPLIDLQRDGVKKMGEIQLAVRFNCPSCYQYPMLKSYVSALLPRMHFTFPLSVLQIDSLRQQAVNMTSLKLARMEPPLRKEVVEDMLYFTSNRWSMRKARVNLERLSKTFGWLGGFSKWLEGICKWKNPSATVRIFFVYIFILFWTETAILFSIISCFLIAAWNWRYRPKNPFVLDIKLSKLDTVNPDELDEEFDTLPSSLTDIDVLRMRYDRLRKVVERVNMLMGDVASQGERVLAILSWQDHRATTYFLVTCSIVSMLVLYLPLRWIMLLLGLYVMRHPHFRTDVFPLAPLNFFRRLPSKEDRLF